jgi:hemolysin activation/secretion protein
LGLESSFSSSPNTDDLRLAASLRYSDLWSLGHTVSANYVVAPQDRTQQEVFAATYSAPVLGTPWTILVSGFSSNSNVAALGGTNVLGNGYQIGVRGIYRLPGSIYQTLGFGVDFKNFNQDIFVGNVNASTSPIRYLPLAIDYTAARETENTSLEVNAGVTLGLRVVKRALLAECEGSNGQTIPCLVDQFETRAPNSRENFLRFTFGASYTLTSKKDFIGIFKLNGQIADSPLVTNEQFGVGGQTSVRGYFVSEAVGDEGVNASVQGETPSFFDSGFIDELRLFGYSDFGYVRSQFPLAGQADDFRLLSVGAGVRIRLFEHFTGQAMFAAPLLDGPLTKTGQPRFTFSARGEF